MHLISCKSNTKETPLEPSFMLATDYQKIVAKDSIQSLQEQLCLQKQEAEQIQSIVKDPSEEQTSISYTTAKRTPISDALFGHNHYSLPRFYTQKSNTQNTKQYSTPQANPTKRYPNKKTTRYPSSSPPSYRIPPRQTKQANKTEPLINWEKIYEKQNSTTTKKSTSTPNYAPKTSQKRPQTSPPPPKTKRTQKPSSTTKQTPRKRSASYAIERDLMAIGPFNKAINKDYEKKIKKQFLHSRKPSIHANINGKEKLISCNKLLKELSKNRYIIGVQNVQKDSQGLIYSMRVRLQTR